MEKKVLEGCSMILLVAVGLVAIPGQISVGEVQSSPSGQFSFAAAGDWGNNFPGSTQTNLQDIAVSGTSFTLALGDLGYISAGQEQAWCTNVQNALGSSYPFEIVAGNHEDDARVNGWIVDYVQYCRDHLGVSKLQGATGVNNVAFYTNGYGAEYYFDYPPSSPTARIIILAQHLTVNGTSYLFNATPMMQWLNKTINTAQAQGLWVIVGEHYPCLDSGADHNGQCLMTTTLEDFLVRKHVDLILTAHEHNYQRSKQLSLSSYCATIGVNSYNPSCVVNDGSSGIYTKGAGTVVVIQGTGGGGRYGLCSGCGDLNWFARSNTASWGFVKYTVTPAQIVAVFVPVAPATFTDSFALVRSVTSRIVSVGPSRYSMYGVPGSGGFGAPVPVNVTIYNGAPLAQVFSVLLSYGSYVTGSKIVTIPPWSNGTGTILSNITGLPIGTSVLKASVNLQGSAVSMGVSFQVLFAGDVNGDGRVDIVDMATIAFHYGQSVGSPGYDYRCDINNDGKVNIIDVAYGAHYFGQHYP